MTSVGIVLHRSANDVKGLQWLPCLKLSQHNISCTGAFQSSTSLHTIHNMSIGFFFFYIFQFTLAIKYCLQNCRPFSKALCRTHITSVKACFLYHWKLTLGGDYISNCEANMLLNVSGINKPFNKENV